MSEERTSPLRWAGILGVLALFLAVVVLFPGGGNTVVVINQSGQWVTSINLGSEAEIRIQGRGDLRDLAPGARVETRVGGLRREGPFHAMAFLADGTVVYGSDGMYHDSGTTGLEREVRIGDVQIEVR